MSGNPFLKYADPNDRAFIEQGWKSGNAKRQELSEDDPTKDTSTFNLIQEGMLKRGKDIATLGTAEKNIYDKFLMERGPAQFGAGAVDLATMFGGGRLLSAIGQFVPKIGPALTAAGDALAVPNTAVKAGLAGGTYAGATTQGGAMDRLKAAGVAGGAGFVLPVSGAVINTGRAMFEPLTEGGQRAIAGRALRHFAGDDPSVLSRLENPEVLVPGSMPTVAEVSGNSGLAALQNSISQLNPAFANKLAQRQAEQRAARLNALQGIAGDEASMQAAIDAREQATEALYEKAKRSVVTGDQTLNQLLQRPTIQSGLTQAKTIAADSGRPFQLTREQPGRMDTLTNTLNGQQNATYLGQGLHDLKLGIDDAIQLSGRREQSQLTAKADFLAWLEKKIPEYGIARTEYAKLSKPINQMEIGQELVKKLQSALSDFGAERETANKFATALREADATAAKATGFKKSKMDDILDPDQLAAAQGVARDLARKANAEDLMRGVGSNTAKNLATQNITRQLFGPLGLPQSWAEATIPQTIMKPLNMIYGGVAEANVANALADGLLNPKLAAELYKLQQKKGLGGLLGNVLDYAPAVAISAGINQ